MPVNFNNVFYTYSEKTPFSHEALKGVTLHISDGSFTCIVGHTGCGKSTLIQQLNGLLIPSSGCVDVNSYHIEKKSKSLKKLHDLRKEVGVVFQFSEYQLFEETIEDDVAFGPMNFGVKKEEAHKIARECLKIVGIPESYFKKSPFEISGGEKRRVAIAGILALQPKILVLDEPTAGLDPKGTKYILDLFKKLNQSGTTIVFVTHDIDIVFEYATNVIVIPLYFEVALPTYSNFSLTFLSVSYSSCLVALNDQGTYFKLDEQKAYPTDTGTIRVGITAKNVGSKVTEEIKNFKTYHPKEKGGLDDDNEKVKIRIIIGDLIIPVTSTPNYKETTVSQIKTTFKSPTTKIVEKTQFCGIICSKDIIKRGIFYGINKRTTGYS